MSSDFISRPQVCSCFITLCFGLRSSIFSPHIWIQGFQIPKGWQINYSIRYTHERAAGKVLQDNGKCAFEPKINRKSQNNKSKQVETLSHGDGVQQSSMEVERTGKFSFIPFGKGARMCAGKNYGLIMLRILLFELVRTVDMQLCGESKLVEIPMTRPHDSVRIQFSSPSIWFSKFAFLFCAS